MDPRVPLLRSHLLKAQQEVVKWSECSSQWKGSAERRQKRFLDLEEELLKTKQELEQTRKRHREELIEVEERARHETKRIILEKIKEELC